MTTTREEVSLFLKQFHAKSKIYGIVYFGEREKNVRALTELGISAKRRDEIVRQISVQDYYKGPEPNRLNNLGDLWMFGKEVNAQTVYIKITLGKRENRTICISFHIAEYPIQYPYKE